MLQTGIKSTRTDPQSVAREEDPRAGKYLSFRLAKEDFAIKVKHIREIMGIQEITALPEMPSYVKGVVNLRGKMIPVIDLRMKFGFPDVEYTSKTCMLVVQVENGSEKLIFGGVVDGVSEVLTLQGRDIDDVPSSGNRVGVAGLLGTVKVKNRLRNLLDINLALTSPELRILESCKEIQVHVSAGDDNSNPLKTGGQLS